ncbi:unnamed protein product [Rotaria sp. Silwood1]|nr:unnamed protein product [Rotaria sp. Silwood1]CAF1428512.1 unnamed protein product [Rotaria sp. Silwood1]CAF3651133.1 unnamed protein product [Rotaria sp. Silwood1]CAF3656739.1 unnamed protein product [Rotaria sp. Silwood1]CAF3705219.1 unnamed protein product [Rotaria sp. Silwood1]
MVHYSIFIWSLLIITTASKENADFNIYGSTANGWEFVKDFLKENFLEQRDLGASVAIYHKGKLVVDLWGGWFDRTQVKPYDKDTLQLVFSTSKGLVAVAAALCVQRGLLDYSELVTKYWPEYGVNGKENTTVADILSHRAGLPFDSSPFEQFFNWTAMIHTLEQQKPVWPPGTTHGYHALTFGWLAGELVRRVDPMKRTLGQFIRDEIATPLNIEFYIGLPSEQEYRVSPIDYKPYGNGTLNQSLPDSYETFNNKSTHQAEIPAANGITNARSIARLYASLIGDVDDNKYKRLINEQILKQATKSNTPEHEFDFVIHFPTKFSMGFILMDDIFPLFGPGVFGHNGVGGSIGFVSPTKQFSFAYVMNRMGAEIAIDVDPRYKSMLNKISTMIDTNASVQKRLSSYLLFLCANLFFYKVYF